MTSAEAKKKLSEITKALIKEELDYLVLKNAVTELKQLLETLSGINMEAQLNSENIALPTGKAIGPKWAGMCLEDLLRTYKFMKGIHAALKTVHSKNPKRPATILYTGTGPYATLILPFLSLYKPSQLQLILLEVNPVSIKSLMNIIKGFDAYKYVKEIYQCDASNFIIPIKLDADILLVECMQRALFHEPQVAITYNLLPQMKEETILIPENISLYLTLIDQKKKTKYQTVTEKVVPMDFYENSEAVFTLNKDEVLKNSEEFKKEDFQFPVKETTFCKEKLHNHDQITVTTEITIFENISLNINESGLTLPLLLANLEQDPTIIGAETKYTLGTDPGLVSKLMRSL